MPDDYLSLDDEARRILGKGTQRLADHAKRIEGNIDKFIAQSEDYDLVTGNHIRYLANEVKQLAACIRAIAEFFS